MHAESENSNDFDEEESASEKDEANSCSNSSESDNRDEATIIATVNQEFETVESNLTQTITRPVEID